MNCQHGCKFRAAKPLGYCFDAILVGRKPNLTLQVRSVKLSVRNWRWFRQSGQLGLAAFRLCLWFVDWFHRRGLPLNRGLPPAHEAEEIPRRDRGVAAGSVEGHEAIPDRLRVDVPAGQGGLSGLDQCGPDRAMDVRSGGDLDLSREDSFVIRFSR